MEMLKNLKFDSNNYTNAMIYRSKDDAQFLLNAFIQVWDVIMCVLFMSFSSLCHLRSIEMEKTFKTEQDN